MSTLIIPDLHHHTENADLWLNSVQFGRVVFLGDHFDDFGDMTDARRTASWLARQMEQPNRIFFWEITMPLTCSRTARRSTAPVLPRPRPVGSMRFCARSIGSAFKSPPWKTGC